MNPPLCLAPCLDLPASIEELRIEAAGEGFRFVDKLVAEWASGRNRFARPGELFLAAFRATDLVAVGGINRDPFTGQEGIGRLRHLYVRKSNRRSRVGSAVVHQLLDHAKTAFHSVRLRTQTPEAADFYVSLGFSVVQDEAATHVKSMRQP